MMYEMLPLQGVINARDLGGYSGSKGKEIKFRRFMRTASLSALTSEDHQKLKEWKVDCVIDLRSSGEVERSPDSLPEDGAIDHYHVPMLDHVQSSINRHNFTAAAFPASLVEMYIGMLENDKESFKRIFDCFASPRYKSYIFHCTAGKDRTGVTAMLLLSLAGVSRELIMEDYAYSEQFAFSAITPEKIGIGKIPAYLLESKPETIKGTLDYLDRNYSGPVEYLKHVGVDAGMGQALVNKLLEDDIT